MKTKKWLVLSLAILTTVGKLQADEWKNVCVKLTDGTEITYALNTTPRFWFMAEWLYVSVGKISTEFTTSEVEKVYYQDRVLTQVESINNESSGVKVYVDKEVVYIRGLSEHSVIKLYSLDGKPLMSPTVTTSTETTLNIRALPSGVYLLQMNKMTAKFIKK
jgi:hypothetical protein